MLLLKVTAFSFYLNLVGYKDDNIFTVNNIN